MIKKLLRAAILLLIFVAAVFAFGLFTDTNKIDLTSEMEEATLPVIYLKSQDTYINQLYGYTNEMDPLTMRDTITPLGEDLKLPVTIHAGSSAVDTVSYAVRTMDMERLLEERKISQYNQKDGVIQTEFSIQNLLEPDEEYMLIITLDSGNKEISYYTRIIRPEKCYVDQTVAFAQDFHEKTFNKEGASELATYLEPSSEGDNTTLQTVTIHSSLNQVTWGDFEGEQLDKAIPSVKEISGSYNIIVLNYIMASTGAQGELEYYNVEEYFKVRYNPSIQRVQLQDYRRTMNEIFRGSGDNIAAQDIKLGIRELDVEYMSNESGTIICFVQEGELWGYNSNTNQLSMIFSFRGAEGINLRENNGEHDIRIMKVDEAGSADFVVYGYMNRGEHEGMTGISVFHYDSVANTIEERAFVESHKSYQVLKEDWGELFYVSDDGVFYMVGDDALYRINLEDCKTQKLLKGFNENNFAASSSGRYIAYREQEKESQVTVMDLEGEGKWQVTAGADEFIRPIGFVDGDFVYGIARVGEVAQDGQYPMYKVVIVNDSHQVIKEYEKSGFYVTNAYVEDETIFLERVWKEGESYQPVERDALKSHEIEASQTIRIDTESNEVKQTMVKLVTAQEFQTKQPQVLTPKGVVVEQQHILSLETEQRKGRYYVYAGGKVILCTESVQEAIQEADESAGVVIGEKQSYIWRRGKKSSFSLADRVVLDSAEAENVTDLTARCLEGMLKPEEINMDVAGLVAGGESPAKILAEAMPEAHILNLTGCTLEQVLYYVNRGTTVFAAGEDGEPLLIVGYDEHNTILYDSASNTTYRKGIQDSGEFFNNAGNVFIGYIP